MCEEGRSPEEKLRSKRSRWGDERVGGDSALLSATSLDEAGLALTNL